jgi:hypothetical protein
MCSLYVLSGFTLAATTFWATGCRGIRLWCEILKNASIPDDKLYIAAYSFFQTIKFFSLKSKHDGFEEEREWRVISMPDRAPQSDWKERFRLHYIIGERGIEPKLIFKVQPVDPAETWTFADILEKIILGPSLSSWLARRGIERLLENVGKPELRDKVCASLIPLRPMN